MDSEGYPEEHELDLIEKWDYRDVFNLLEYVKERWCYNDCFRTKWEKDRLQHKYHVLSLELHTGGWSGNEDIINSLMRNGMFAIWHTKWEVGGHWYFEINPKGVGFKTVKDYCTENNVSRQYVHYNNHKFQWIIATPNLRFIRPL